jgi:hypothetical protein
VKRYMFFIHEGGPVVGAVEVPPCFTPTQELLNVAAESDLDIALVEEHQLPEGGLEALLLAQGKDMLDILRRLSEDPTFMAEQFTDIDPTLN